MCLRNANLRMRIIYMCLSMLRKLPIFWGSAVYLCHKNASLGMNHLGMPSESYSGHAVYMCLKYTSGHTYFTCALERMLDMQFTCSIKHAWEYIVYKCLQNTSRTFVARTLMVRFPRLFRTHSYFPNKISHSYRHNCILDIFR